MILGEVGQTLFKSHYYGDIVRLLFLAGAVLMLFFLPFFSEIIPVSVPVALFTILALGIFAGVTNPRQLVIAVFDTIIATLAVVVFGYYAIDAYLKYTGVSLYFWANQVLAVDFLFALYYSTKTLRGFLLKHSPDNQ